MVKQLTTLALFGLLAIPSVAISATNTELASEIQVLKKQLKTLENKMEEQQDTFVDLEEKSEGWDLASRIQISGDIRNRIDYHSLKTPDHYTAKSVASGAALFVGAKSGVGTDTGMDGAIADFGFTDIDSMVAGLSGSLTDLTTWTTNTAAYFTPAQAEAIFIMFTDPGVGALLTQMGAMPATTISNAMASYQSLVGLMKMLPASSRKAIFDQMAAGIYAPLPSQEWENESSYTTRLRMNMRVKASENIEVKARVVAYKFWGNQTSQNGETDEFGVHLTDGNPYFLNSRSFDGTVGRQPGDSAIVLDRAFMNWNNIGNIPLWFSIGRRPTTDGPPAQLRMGADQRLATPVNYMDYPFDGISLGYAYNNLFGLTDGPGRIRFCYGRGFEAGSSIEDSGMNDVDFAGLSWDVYKKGGRFLSIQSFGAFNLFNVPGDTVFPSPFELALDDAVAAGNMSQATADDQNMNNNGVLDRKNMGNIYHTAAVYMDEIASLNYFVTLGWSHTAPNDDVDEMGISFLNDSWNEPEDKDGYGVYIGARYDFDDLGLKVGAEYNWGSENYLAFTPGHDDLYGSKLQTRGSVYEAYVIYDLPGGEVISKFCKTFVRLGYQHYKYDYTYSGMWLGAPTKIDDLADDPLTGQFYAPVDTMDQVYLSFEAYF